MEPLGKHNQKAGHTKGTLPSPVGLAHEGVQGAGQTQTKAQGAAIPQTSTDSGIMYVFRMLRTKSVSSTCIHICVQKRQVVHVCMHV